MGIRIKILKSYVDKVLNNIPFICDVSFLFALYIILRYSYLKWFWNLIILGIYYLWLVFIKAFDKYRREELYKPDFPNVKKRFTKRLDGDMIVVKKSDWEEAMLYLCEIEDYLNK